MALTKIVPPSFDVEIALAYATAANFTGKPVYGRAACYLHSAAAERLGFAIDIARPFGLRFKILDAFRPSEAQWVPWRHTPDPSFLADPRKGSPHSRGVALDLTLIGRDGRDLDTGTAYDSFTPLSHHGRTAGLTETVQRSRLTLLGTMTAAGWECYRHEWWHYQLFNARDYPLLSDNGLDEPMMPQPAGRAGKRP